MLVLLFFFDSENTHYHITANEVCACDTFTVQGAGYSCHYLNMRLIF